MRCLTGLVLSGVVVVVVKSSRKAGIVMVMEHLAKAVELGYVPLLKKLVSEELDRKSQAIDDTILRVYDVVPAKHTDKAIAEVSAAVLNLVMSPLADLARSLACVEVEPEKEPEPEPAPEVKPEPEPEPAPEIRGSRG